MIRSILLSLFLLLNVRTWAYKGAQMGELSHECDDARTNLTVDWPHFSFKTYTCPRLQHWPVRKTPVPFHFKKVKIPGFDPKTDEVVHHCMNDTLEYKDKPPLRGDHRPNWAKYGEYLYLPPQRWLHNLEHGSIIALYHPCADENEVEKLRHLVTSCLYRHIITPYPHLGKTRPLALVSWGHKVEMNHADEAVIKKFIQDHAHIAPEDISRDGKYDRFLLRHSIVVSDEDDSMLCPAHTDFQFKRLKRHTRGPAQRRQKRRMRRPAMIGLSDPNTEYYERIYLQQLKQYNGPKYASDVLPPTALLNQFKQPHYVMAGTYLGKDPLNPQIMRHTPQVPPKNRRPPPQSQQQQQQQQIRGPIQQQQAAAMVARGRGPNQIIPNNNNGQRPATNRAGGQMLGQPGGDRRQHQNNILGDFQPARSNQHLINHNMPLQPSPGNQNQPIIPNNPNNNMGGFRGDQQPFGSPLLGQGVNAAGSRGRGGPNGGPTPNDFSSLFQQAGRGPPRQSSGTLSDADAASLSSILSQFSGGPDSEIHAAEVPPNRPANPPLSLEDIMAASSSAVSQIPTSVNGIPASLLWQAAQQQLRKKPNTLSNNNMQQPNSSYGNKQSPSTAQNSFGNPNQLNGVSPLTTGQNLGNTNGNVRDTLIKLLLKAVTDKNSSSG